MIWTIDKSYYYGNQEIEKNKYAFNKNFGETLTSVFKELNNDEFINILESKIGIHNLIRNNIELQGAGVHKIFNNGFLCMHTDFEGYNDKQNGILDRRINLLLYMNPEWKEYYGGELCLYDRTYRSITKKNLPILHLWTFKTPTNLSSYKYNKKYLDNGYADAY